MVPPAGPVRAGRPGRRAAPGHAAAAGRAAVAAPATHCIGIHHLDCSAVARHFGFVSSNLC